MGETRAAKVHRTEHWREGCTGRALDVSRRPTEYLVKYWLPHTFEESTRDCEKDHLRRSERTVLTLDFENDSGSCQGDRITYNSWGVG